MPTAALYQRFATARDLRFFCDPSLWPQHPFLPVVRRPVGQEDPECGVLYDARATSGRCGYSATVFLVLCGTPHNTSYADPRVMLSW